MGGTELLSPAQHGLDPAADSADADRPGRACPLRYRYGAAALAGAPQCRAEVLYVVGGLYGNTAALDALDALVRVEPAATLCFNGDFHWFDVDDARFDEVSRRVLVHHAIAGNVEAELGSASDAAGCGCAYPDHVDAGIVERSNRIHQRLKDSARRHPQWLGRLSRLPMLARWRVGDARIGVVHGDADALAGWSFDVTALDDPAAQPWLRSVFALAQVDVFASSHTCLPALRRIDRGGAAAGWVVNNGAAGMPNFAGERAGLCTRIAVTPSPHPVLHEVRTHGVHVALLPLRYDHARWLADFGRQWPPGSPAWVSYHRRIVDGPAFTRADALRGAG